MKLEHSFDVAAPLQRVWEALIDVEYVAPCLPGAAITGRDEDGGYRGTFTVKLGPTTAAYNGVLRIGEVDEAGHRATLHARGTDKRGQGGATATIVNTVSEAGDGMTRVHADTDFTITGRLARFGRGGMIEDISQRLLQEFAGCLQEKLVADGDGAADEAVAAGPTPEEEAEALAAVPEAAAAAPVVVDEPVAPEPAAPEPVAPEAPAPRTGSVAPPGQPAPPQAVPSGATAPRAPAKPVNGLSLLLSVLWKRLRGLFSGGRRAH